MWPNPRPHSPKAVHLRVFVRGQVRHSSWVEPESLRRAVFTIRSVFRRLVPHESFAVVGDRAGLSVIITRVTGAPPPTGSLAS